MANIEVDMSVNLSHKEISLRPVLDERRDACS